MLKAIHAQEDRKAAAVKAKAVVAKLTAMKLRKATTLVRETVNQTLTYYAFPSTHWRQIRTNNPLERIIREIRHRTRVVGVFSRWPVRVDAGRGAASSYRGDQVGHETLPRSRAPAINRTSAISCVDTQTEALPI